MFNKDSDVTNNALPIEKIVVRGGMYDVELDKMKCVSIYCPGIYFIQFQFHNFIKYDLIK